MARKIKELYDKMSPERQAIVKAGTAKILAEMALHPEGDPQDPESESAGAAS